MFIRIKDDLKVNAPLQFVYGKLLKNATQLPDKILHAR